MFPSARFLGVTLYSWGYVLAVIIVILFSLFYLKKYQMTIEKLFLLGILIIPSIFSTIHFIARLESAGTFNWVRATAFMPIVIYLISLTLNFSFTKTIDFLAPCFALAHGVAHIFCIFPGCCYGYPSTFGIWNAKHHAYLFPVQLFESATLLLIAWYIVWYAKKRGYKTRGISYAQFLFLFGLSRTFWEFFRDNTEVRWQISIFQYYSFAAFVLGSIWLIATFYLDKHPEFVKKYELFFRDDVGELTRIKMFLRKRKRNR